MAFFLPAQPSFGNRLADVLGKSIGDIGSGLIQRNQQKQAKNELDKLLNPQPDQAQMEGQEGQQGPQPLNWQKALNVYNLASKAYGKDAADTYLKNYVDQQQQAVAQQQKAQQMAAQQQQRIELAEKQSALRQEEASAKEAAVAKKEEAKYQKELKSVKGTVDRLRELKSQIGYTFGAVTGFNQVFNRKQIQDRKEADSLGFLLADKVYTHFNKGTISNAKLALIKQELAPGSDMSEREYEGRIRALERILQLPRNASESDVDSVVNESKASKPPLTSFIR